ncbi:hypothetical protein IOD13_09380 [Brevibacterium casei]|nr:hypothetical protein [Brevibacterium casei]
MAFDFTWPSNKAVILNWNDAELASWDQLATTAQEMSHRIDNPGFNEETSRRAVALLNSMHPERHPELEDRKICRAVVSLWARDPTLAERTMRTPILQSVCENGRMTRLFVFALANMYFTYFDQLDIWDEGLFALTAELLQRGVAEQKDVQESGLVRAFRKYPEVCLGIAAPEKLARLVVDRDCDLLSVMREVGLGDFTAGRFAEFTRQRVYLDRITAADPRKPHAWLRELCDSDLVNAPTAGGLRFGHLVIEAMTAVPVEAPSREWEGTILHIAGEPRARGTVRWNTWWSRIPEDNVRRIITWLSGEDIRLFLEAVKIFGEKNGKSDLGRMFPDRERFLKRVARIESRSRNPIVCWSLGPVGDSRDYGRELRTDISQLVGGNYGETAVIYMNCGGFHVVEGSHNFKLWIIKDDPPELLADWKRDRIQGPEFLHALRTHGREHQDHRALTHNVHKKWISDALLFIEHSGTYVPPEAVMSPETYRKVSAERPLPVRPKYWRPSKPGEL